MVNATKEVFISKSHQKAMTAEGEDVETVYTRQTKKWRTSSQSKT